MIAKLNGWDICQIQDRTSAFDLAFYAFRISGREYSEITGEHYDTFEYLHRDGTVHASLKNNVAWPGYFITREEIERVINEKEAKKPIRHLIDEYEKVVNNGDLYYLYKEDGSHIQMEVIDSGIYAVSNGSWQPGIEFRYNGTIDQIPFSMFYDLFHKGQIYKYGSEEMAKVLRKVHKERKNVQIQAHS